MMIDERLFGTLHSPVKPYFEGLTTDTIEVLVDSSEKTVAANLTPKVLDAFKAAKSEIATLQDKIVILYNDLVTINNALNTLGEDLDKQISEIEANIQVIDEQLVTLASKDELAEVVSKIPEAVSQLENDIGYLTESSLVGYATEEYVEGRIADLDINPEDIDLSNYYTREETDTLLNNIDLIDPNELITD